MWKARSSSLDRFLAAYYHIRIPSMVDDVLFQNIVDLELDDVINTKSLLIGQSVIIF